eukprot:Colp12_sorted_trinity150504_noHs@25561
MALFTLSQPSVLDEVDEVIKDVLIGVSRIEVVSKSEEAAVISIRTLEDVDVEVLFDCKGFKITKGLVNNSQTFESLHSLLDSISSGYRNAFADSFSSKLAALERRSQPEDWPEGDSL